MQVSQSTLKKLFALSGNKCAFPDCNQMLVDGEHLYGEVCHIRAAKFGGKRYDEFQSESAKNACDNLVILCPNHHSLIDSDEEKYSVELLVKMKKDHESLASFDGADEDYLEKLAIFLGGLVVGGLVAHEYESRRDVVLSVSEAASFLQLGPAGKFYFQSTNGTRAEKVIVDFLSSSLVKAGWSKLPEDFRMDISGVVESELFGYFVLPSRNEIENAGRVINRMLKYCGFRQLEGNDYVDIASGDAQSLKLSLAFGSRH